MGRCNISGLKNWLISGINVYLFIFIELVENILAEIKVLTVVIFYVVGIILILDPKGGTF